jgi:hypothetical protein
MGNGQRALSPTVSVVRSKPYHGKDMLDDAHGLIM